MKSIFLSILFSFFISDVSSQSWSLNGPNLFSNPLTTKVGIGINSPLSLLHISANGVSGNLTPAALVLDVNHLSDWGFGILLNTPSSRITKAFVITKAGTENFLIYNDGRVYAREINVKVGALGDFVFHPEYNLMPLGDVENYLLKNSHLPGIPSANEVKKNGMDLGEFQNLLLQKVEELTLYVIQLNKENEALKIEVEKLKLNK